MANRRFQQPDTAVCETVIITTILRRGSGKDEKDPVRIVLQVFTLDGDLIAENDSFTEL
jgi:hypothetical protein